MDIRSRIEIVKERIAGAAERSGRRASDIYLVAASKTFSSETIRHAFEAGIGIFGENRVQEMLQKHSEGAYDGAALHFIGHLQKNKVSKVVGTASLIQSVNSVELLDRIDRRACELGIKQDILFEINIAGEQSKTGAPPELLPGLLAAVERCRGVFLRGLMSIPPIADEKGANRGHFSNMYKLFIDISLKKYDNVSMDFLSLGMSGDFTDAIAEGANMVRVGSAIFGTRPPAASALPEIHSLTNQTTLKG